jgi:hypothetical protein
MGSVARLEAIASLAWVERFWSFVDQRGPVNVEGLGPCWRWTGSVSKGYGQLQIGTHDRPIPEKAHRLAWHLFNGAVPPTMHVLHKCDWPTCCRPAHLFLGGPRENAIDRERKGRGLRGRSNPGETNNHARLSNQNVLAIRAERAAGVTNVQLAKKYGVNVSTISKAALGKNWSHLSTEVSSGQP